MHTQTRRGENPVIGCPHGMPSPSECVSCLLESGSEELVKKNEPVIVKLSSGAYERDWKAKKVENGKVFVESRDGEKMEADVKEFIAWQERKEEPVYFNYEFVNDFQIEVFHDDLGDYEIAFRTVDPATLLAEEPDAKNRPIRISTDPDDAKKVFEFAKLAAEQCFNSACLRNKLLEHLETHFPRVDEQKKAA